MYTLYMWITICKYYNVYMCYSTCTCNYTCGSPYISYYNVYMYYSTYNYTCGSPCIFYYKVYMYYSMYM